MTKQSYTIFDQNQIIAQGTLPEVIWSAREKLNQKKASSILIFCDQTGNTMNFTLDASKDAIEKQLVPYTKIIESNVQDTKSVGRPKLGVVSREVSLLPRHWEYLASQSGGASASIRRLVEQSQKNQAQSLDIKQQQERCYRVMTTIAGNLDGYEEALRALYKQQKDLFAKHTRSWPKDVKKYLKTLSYEILS
ncbi:MAG: DUF2239 family protein [Bdellovibrionota bacterium]